MNPFKFNGPDTSHNHGSCDDDDRIDEVESVEESVEEEAVSDDTSNGPASNHELVRGSAPKPSSHTRRLLAKAKTLPEADNTTITDTTLTEPDDVTEIEIAVGQGQDGGVCSEMEVWGGYGVCLSNVCAGTCNCASGAYDGVKGSMIWEQCEESSWGTAECSIESLRGAATALVTLSALFTGDGDQ